MGTRGRAPYLNVLTHGFVVDGEGKKMSKSVGNVIDSQTIIDEYGAEILRLWVAAEDYTEDIRISEEILKRLVEAYRRIRNTSRFILGNLYDFNPGTDTVPYAEMAEMDRWILHRLQEVIRRVREAYEQYQFHVVYYHPLQFLHGGPLRALPRRPEGPSLHLEGGIHGPPVGPDGDDGDPGGDGPAPGPHPHLHGGGGVACPARLSRQGRERPPYPVSGGERDLPSERSWRRNGRRLSPSRGRWRKAIEAARQNKILGHSLDAAVVISAPEKLRTFLWSAP